MGARSHPVRSGAKHRLRRFVPQLRSVCPRPDDRIADEMGAEFSDGEGDRFVVVMDDQRDPISSLSMEQATEGADGFRASSPRKLAELSIEFVFRSVLATP